MRPSSTNSRRSASSKRLADFDAAARQMPAGDIAVLDQKHPVLAVQHHAADPERHAAGEAPIEMETPPQRRLERSVAVLQVHRRRFPISAILFDPCVASAGLPLHGKFTGYHEMIVWPHSRTGPPGSDVMAAFTLAHLSDPHLPPLPAARLGDLAGKRALGYLNWTRNRHKYHRRDVLDALVSDMQAQAPDHIAVTGDFVNLALDAEFEPARAWLESVGSPERVTIVPGNHDAYVRATPHRFVETLDDYLGDDGRPVSGNRFPSCAGAVRWR